MDLAALKAAWAQLKAFKPSSRKAGEDVKAKKGNLKKMIADFQEKYNEAGAAATSVVSSKEVKSLTKEKMDAIKSFTDASAPAAAVSPATPEGDRATGLLAPSLHLQPCLTFSRRSLVAPWRRANRRRKSTKLARSSTSTSLCMEPKTFSRRIRAKQ